MTALELNVGNAILTAKEVITKMMSQGLGEAKYIYAVSKMLSEKYELTMDQSIVVIEETLKMMGIIK